jgi:RimJ/RimL family protein N-acetyltransferase
LESIAGAGCRGPAGWRIETLRLLLRPPQPDDLAPLLAGVFADAEVMRYVNAGAALCAADAAAFFTTKLDVEATGRKPGVVVDKATAAVIGYAGPMACCALGTDDIEIGFVLARSAWGRGYGSELGRAQLDHAFGTLRCARVLALAAPGNAASIATLLKIGMRFDRAVDLPGRGARNVYVAVRR